MKFVCLLGRFLDAQYTIMKTRAAYGNNLYSRVLISRGVADTSLQCHARKRIKSEAAVKHTHRRHTHTESSTENAMRTLKILSRPLCVSWSFAKDQMVWWCDHAAFHFSVRKNERRLRRSLFSVPSRTPHSSDQQFATGCRLEPPAFPWAFPWRSFTHLYWTWFRYKHEYLINNI